MHTDFLRSSRGNLASVCISSSVNCSEIHFCRPLHIDGNYLPKMWKMFETFVLYSLCPLRFSKSRERKRGNNSGHYGRYGTSIQSKTMVLDHCKSWFCFYFSLLASFIAIDVLFHLASSVLLKHKIWFTTSKVSTSFLLKYSGVGQFSDGVNDLFLRNMRR